MDEKEQDIDLLTKGRNYIEQALNFLRDVEDFSDEDYGRLSNISEDINNLIIKKKTEIERLGEI